MAPDTPAPGALDLYPDGFTLLPFPADVRAAMRKEIASFILSALEPGGGGDGLDRLSAIVMAMNDEEFVATFRKGFRTFPDAVSAGLAPWIETEIKHRLCANEIAMTTVCAADMKTNPTLKPDSYDVYWRIVRPNRPDVAGPHIDATFAYLNEDSDRAIPLPFDYTSRWRVWVPLLGCTKANSLQFIPGSQNEHFPATSIDTPNGPRPSVGEDWKRANMGRFVCPFSEFEETCVLFPDTVVHNGPVNGEAHVRISADFTIVMR